MPFIHEHPRWPEFTWDAAALAAPLAALRHRQGRLLGRLEALRFEVRSEANLATLTSDVVRSSAIEGEKLDPREVRSSLARRLGLAAAGLPRPGRDVEGVVEMTIDATQKFDTPLTRDRLFAWHAALFPAGRSSLRRITTGAWRTADAGPMQVVSGPPGRERVHFEAPDADRLEAEMAAFLTWFNAPPAGDPVLKAAVAHFWFVTVHPFEDGNGRIARAIADMALARAEGSRQRFASMSAQIEKERSDYYRRLEAAQRGGLDISRWLEWFLGCLDRSLDGAEASLASVLRKGAVWQRLQDHSVNERQRAVLNRLLDGFTGFLTTSKYARLAKCSTDTALRDIRELVERGVLVRNAGGGRSTSYALATSGIAEPFSIRQTFRNSES